MTPDRTDKRILAILERDARQSMAAIGREIALSRTAVQDRVKKLEHAGVIQGYFAATNADQVDLVRALVFVKIASRPCDKALKWLSTLEGVVNVYSLTGETDAVVICALPSTKDLTHLNDKIGASALVSSSSSEIILRQI